MHSLPIARAHFKDRVVQNGTKAKPEESLIFSGSLSSFTYIVMNWTYPTLRFSPQNVLRTQAVCIPPLPAVHAHSSRCCVRAAWTSPAQTQEMVSASSLTCIALHCRETSFLPTGSSNFCFLGESLPQLKGGNRN